MTTQKNANKILKTGLKSIGRPYVYLSNNIESAIIVGKRRISTLVILVVVSTRTFENGYNFYKEPSDIWLSDYIESQYITIK